MSNHTGQQGIYQKIRFALAAFAFLLGVMPGLGLAATLNQDWVARYNGPANDWDTAKAVAVDAAGNVYVTGLSAGSSAYDYDYATIKYDANGNQLWLARYDGPGSTNGPVNGWDEPNDMTVDTAGNVYVTGYSASAATSDVAASNDYVTIKYDTNGNQLWLARYNGPGNGSDAATDIAVDASGNVYVTGYSTNPSAPDDFATIKYDASGNQLWVARYSGGASALAVDAAGNVYVTGKSYDSISSFDYATIKYDTNGNQLWLARYNGPGNSYDAATELAVDASGNVHVTGSSFSSGTDYDYATVKYDANGNQLWVAPYNGPGNSRDLANALAADAAGNIYVTGESTGSGTAYDYATIKYDANGNQQWLARYNGPGNGLDSGRDLAVDGSGNVYVTGSSIGSASRDYATVKYDANGNPLWEARYNGPGNNEDYASALAVDGGGNIYVTGTSKGFGSVNDPYLKAFDYATIKYSQNDAPVANAGLDQLIRTTSSKATAVTLNGSASSDPNGDALTYTWSGVFGTVSGVNPVVKLVPGLYTITLTVSDGQLTATDTVVIEVLKVKK